MARAHRFHEHDLGPGPGRAQADGKSLSRVGATELALSPREERTHATPRRA
jgi:hypothetical protein